MNKKAFTLAELLGVIVILSIILMLVAIPMTKRIQSGKETVYESQMKVVELGTEAWMNNNKDSLPQNEDESITITVGTLKQEGELETDIVDPTTGECIPNNTEITITKKNGKYEIKIDIDSGTDDCPDIDTTSPIIYLNGEAIEYVEFGSEWVDKGAIAKTNTGVPITDVKSKVTKNGPTINTSQFKDYEITYSAADNGITVTVKRTIIIVDTTPPTLTIPPDITIDSTVASIDPTQGVTAYDLADGDLTYKIITTGNVVTKQLGEYIITYEVEDSHGNKTTGTRKIRVVDKSKPTITTSVQDDPFNSNGWAKSAIKIKVKVSDTGGSGPAGYKICTDTAMCNPSRFVAKVVDYPYITTDSKTNYLCVIPVDNAGNEGSRRCEGPHKLDTKKPSITFPATTNINQSAGSYNLKSGASVSDNLTPTNQINWTATSNLDFDYPGEYTITYTATDLAGNTQTATRKVKIIDDIPPTLTVDRSCTSWGENSWCRGTLTATLRPSDDPSGIDKYQYSYNGSTWYDLSGSTDKFYDDDDDTIYYRVIDGAGNASSRKTFYIMIDTERPSISFPSSTNVYQSSGSFNLKSGITVSDNLTPTSDIRVYTDSDFNLWDAGYYYIDYTVKDLAGNTRTATRSVRVIDDAGPSISIDEECDDWGDDGWCKGTYTVNIDAYDSSGISEYEASTDGYSWTTCDSSVSYSGDGDYYRYFRATDGNDNTSSRESAHIKIDGTSPDCSASYSGTKGNNNWYTSNVSGSLDYDDDTSGVRYYAISSSYISSSSSRSSSTSYSSDTSSQSFYGYVQDYAGNVTRCESGSFKKDSTPPYRVNVQLCDGGKVTKSINVTSDTDSSGTVTATSGRTINVDNTCKCANGPCGQFYRYMTTNSDFFGSCGNHWRTQNLSNIARDNMSGIDTIKVEVGTEHGSILNTGCSTSALMTKTDKIYSIDKAGNVGPKVTVNGRWHY